MQREYRRGDDRFVEGKDLRQNSQFLPRLADSSIGGQKEGSTAGGGSPIPEGTGLPAPGLGQGRESIPTAAVPSLLESFADPFPFCIPQLCKLPTSCAHTSYAPLRGMHSLKALAVFLSQRPISSPRRPRSLPYPNVHPETNGDLRIADSRAVQASQRKVWPRISCLLCWNLLLYLHGYASLPTLI